jgi:hypothetical protein
VGPYVPYWGKLAWKKVLLDVKKRGLEKAPKLVGMLGT